MRHVICGKHSALGWPAQDPGDLVAARLRTADFPQHKAAGSAATSAITNFQAHTHNEDSQAGGRPGGYLSDGRDQRSSRYAISVRESDRSERRFGADGWRLVCPQTSGQMRSVMRILRPARRSDVSFGRILAGVVFKLNELTVIGRGRGAWPEYAWLGDFRCAGKC